MLQVGVDGSYNILSGDGFLVHFPVLVPRLNLVVGIPEVDVVTFLSSQVGFAGRLKSRLAGVVTGAVFSGMSVQVGLIHLGNIAKKVAAGIERVVPDTSDLSLETRELVLDFGKLHIFLGGELLHHYDRLVADSSAVLAVFSHFTPDEVRLNIQDACKEESVKFLDFLRGYENVVCYLVADYDLSVPVVDDTSGRVYDVIDHRVV